MKKIKVGEILEINKHTNADKLLVLNVQVGSDILPIVTNYHEVKEGDKVIVATVGAELHHPNGVFTITPTNLRGVLSYGMLCDEQALGLPKTLNRILFESDLETLRIKLED